jgi:hypothetical protein
MRVCIAAVNTVPAECSPASPRDGIGLSDIVFKALQATFLFSEQP